MPNKAPDPLKSQPLAEKVFKIGQGATHPSSKHQEKYRRHARNGNIPIRQKRKHEESQHVGHDNVAMKHNQSSKGDFQRLFFHVKEPDNKRKHREKN